MQVASPFNGSGRSPVRYTGNGAGSLLREREDAKMKLMNSVKEGDLVRGTVTNIADFGAFIDLGGIDGLLHITDMSWGRVNHPSEIVKIGEEIEIKILNIDRDKEKIALGLKQKETSPWDEIEGKFPTIGDMDRSISTAYGMIDPGTSADQGLPLTIRAVFILSLIHI